jgi:hypothetical protein
MVLSLENDKFKIIDVDRSESF